MINARIILILLAYVLLLCHYEFAAIADNIKEQIVLSILYLTAILCFLSTFVRPRLNNDGRIVYESSSKIFKIFPDWFVAFYAVERINFCNLFWLIALGLTAFLVFIGTPVYVIFFIISLSISFCKGLLGSQLHALLLLAIDSPLYALSLSVSILLIITGLILLMFDKWDKIALILWLISFTIVAFVVVVPVLYSLIVASLNSENAVLFIGSGIFMSSMIMGAIMYYFLLIFPGAKGNFLVKFLQKLKNIICPVWGSFKISP